MFQNIIENYQLNEYPLVSVIVPAYNAQEYIGATLESLHCQRYPHLEIIVVDDGSTDQTVQIVKNAMIKDRRIRLFQQKNSGVAAARNRGILHSKGSFIAPVDADDICYPDKIEKLVNCFQTAGNHLGLAYSWSAFIDQNGNLSGKGQRSEFEGDVFEYLLFSNFVGNGSSCLIRRNCFNMAGFYNTSFFSQQAQGCEDHDIYLRIAEHFQFKVIKDFLTGYRKTEYAMSKNYKCMEKSKQLVFQNVKSRNPWIPDIVFDWSSAYFALWLSSLAASNGSYHDCMRYLIKAAQYDPLLIKNYEYLKRIYNYTGRSFKTKLKSAISIVSKINCLKKTHHYHVLPAKISITDLKQKPCLQPQKSSLGILKEKRMMHSCYLIRQARINNGHFIR